MIEKERERERERERENSILCVVSYTCAGVDNDDDTNDDERKHESQRNIIIIFAAPNRKPISSHLSPLMTSYIESSLPLTPTLLLTFSVFHPPPPLSLLPFTLLASPSLRLRLICSTPSPLLCLWGCRLNVPFGYTFLESEWRHGSRFGNNVLKFSNRAVFSLFVTHTHGETQKHHRRECSADGRDERVVMICVFVSSSVM